MPDRKHQPAAGADDRPPDEDEDGGVRRPLIGLVVVVAAGIGFIVALTLIERHLGPPQVATVATVANTVRPQHVPEQFPWQLP